MKRKEMRLKRHRRKREDADETLGGVRKRALIPEGSPASERSAAKRGSGKWISFPVQHVSINGEWRVTISTDQGDPRGALRMLEEIGARRVEVSGAGHGQPSSSSDVAPAFGFSAKGGSGKEGQVPEVTILEDGHPNLYITM